MDHLTSRTDRGAARLHRRQVPGRSLVKAEARSALQKAGAPATADPISLGRVVVDRERNEITAIPKLLDLLAISDACLVSIKFTY